MQYLDRWSIRHLRWCQEGARSYWRCWDCEINHIIGIERVGNFGHGSFYGRPRALGSGSRKIRLACIALYGPVVCKLLEYRRELLYIRFRSFAFLQIDGCGIVFCQAFWCALNRLISCYSSSKFALQYRIWQVPSIPCFLILLTTLMSQKFTHVIFSRREEKHGSKQEALGNTVHRPFLYILRSEKTTDGY